MTMNVTVSEIADALGLPPRELAGRLGLSTRRMNRLLSGSEEPDELTKWALVGLKSVSLTGQPLDEAFESPIGPLAEPLQGTNWASRTARLIIPILVDAIKAGRRDPMTYTQVYDEARNLGAPKNIGLMTKMAFPCGRVASAMEVAADLLDEDVPPLTALVVSESTGLPSKGIDPYIVDYLGKAATRGMDKPERRREVLQTVWDDIHAYPKWDMVMSVLGVRRGQPY